ncbi:hypothetical protein [Clostridium polynesiense]|uniref:hypothetical protein n=1 Tax=Clostridium polynesiense TaxID=1325933 RepID=UPI00058B578A|nr:hypothetical protein [Clostridium polynesiense]
MEIKKSNKIIFKGLLVKGNFHSAIAYLNQFTDKQKLAESYKRLFEALPEPKVKNIVIKEILQAFLQHFLFKT